MAPYILSESETDESVLVSKPMPSIKGTGTQITSQEMSEEARYIWVITGPAGCGKSTVGRHLSTELGLPYLEGDEYHPQSNIEKMSSGHPLDDSDRWSWLRKLGQEAHSRLEKPSTPSPDLPEAAHGVVMTCSALKRIYRDFIRTESKSVDGLTSARFIYLRISEKVSLERVKARQGHYMKDDMVKSQFAALEEPTTDEDDCFTIDVSGPPSRILEMAMRVVKGVPGTHEVE